MAGKFWGLIPGEYDPTSRPPEHTLWLALGAHTKAVKERLHEARWVQSGALTGKLQRDLPEVNDIAMQPAATAPPDVLSQNLKALTKIIDTQQQMMDQQQDWLHHSLATFKMPKMAQDDDLETYIEAIERHALMTRLDKGYWASQLGALIIVKAQAAY
ncbi:hypothetical protein Y1Q_0024374 [Alligator mississippiensis]|uniref:Uncharacterized protein n=1 Tax=Alligator mississippiensis TaxID=8496 RepID=A0A151NIT7_ALLMI|nr:hypothetical protein Y1Q_0024374 [Alligator mississippiensis]